MRIYGPSGASIGTPSANTRRQTGSGFSLPDTSTAAETRPSSAPKSVANIDALLALQGVEDPTGRRKRAVRRGRTALHVLDDLKLGLLVGTLHTAPVPPPPTAPT